MHWIQRHIIHELILNPKLRYSRIKPGSVEGNLFMYHLGKLLRQGLVIKKRELYELTAKGQQYADQLSLKTLKPRIQPKIVTLVAVQNDRGEFLLYRRKRQPFVGRVGFPYGKIHLGETIQQAAERELKEKTGLKAKLTHRGEVYLTIYQGKDRISHMLCHVFSGTSPSGRLKAESDIGDCFWEKVAEPNSDRYFPGFAKIYELLKKPGTARFFAETDLQAVA